ncbi:MAG: hypothetical protein BM556_14860 [Bacteriovorax sp. MedPE-SWde]|nr:MAG: hypothetical protein BM556_14860 [Bacteriovorax sp. MedPE-SWde]
MKFIIIIIFCINSNALTKEQCPSINYEDRFTPTRDQDGNGLCWAFSGSALIEEQFCIESPEKCGKEQVSIIDGHRCFWNQSQGLGTRKTAAAGSGYFTDCVINNGVCLEENAPFMETIERKGESQNKYNRLVARALRSTSRAKDKYEIVTHNGCIDISKGQINSFLEDFGKITNSLIQDMSIYYGRLNINYEKALLSSKHYTDALKGIFITQDCKENRQFLKTNNIRPRIKFIEFKTPNKKFTMLKERLMKGRSVSIGLCGQRARNDRFEDLFFMSSWGTTKEEYEKKVENSRCGNHSVVVNGMKFKNGRCLINIRNSWGEGSGLEGWEDAENILKHTKTLEYLEVK